MPAWVLNDLNVMACCMRRVFNKMRNARWDLCEIFVCAGCSNPDKAPRSSLQPGEALSLCRLPQKQPRTVCQIPGRAQIKLSITGRVYGNYMFVNMLEKCALGSSSVCSEKQFCSEITFQMDEGDPHQI